MLVAENQEMNPIPSEKGDPMPAEESVPAASNPEGASVSSDFRTEAVNLPNSLTLLRIFLVPFLVVVLLTKFDGKEFVGLGIFLIAAVTDFFDGYIARRTNRITRLGALLDPIADKLLISAAFISLVEIGMAPAWMVVVIIGREFAVNGLRLVAVQQGVTIAASKLGKGKTISQVIAISVLILGHQLGEFVFIGKVLLWIVVIFALGSAVDYFMKFAKAVVMKR